MKTLFFEKKIYLIFSFIGVFLLFLPKINLISFNQETSGLRIDDFILVILFCVVCWASIGANKKIFEIDVLILAIVFFSALSFFINNLLFSLEILHVQSKIFYVVRIIEYFLFFYIGALGFRFFHLKTIISMLLLVNILFMVLQKLGIVGILTQFSENQFDTQRVTGLSSFPAEMGAILNLIFAYFLVKPQETLSKIKVRYSGQLGKVFQNLYSIFLLFFFMILVGLTGARIALAALFIIFFLYQFQENKKLAVSVLLFSILPISLIVYFSDVFIFRLDRLFSFENLNIISHVWDSIDTRQELYDNIQMVEGNYDMSWWIRIHKWCYALKVYSSHPGNYLLGIGPGAFSAAVDGSFLRILTENGLIGCFCYLILFKNLYQISNTMKWVIIAFALNMIFFDTYLAYKPMALLFFMGGYFYAEHLKETTMKRHFSS